MNDEYLLTDYDNLEDYIDISSQSLMLELSNDELFALCLDTLND